VYIVHINGHPIFSDTSSLHKLAKIVKLAPTLSTPMLELIVSPDSPPSRLHSFTGTPHLQLDQFRTVIHALYEMGEDIPMPYDEVPTPEQLEDLVYNTTVSEGMIPGSNWTHHQLKRLNCWAEWFAADKEKVDGMAVANMFGKPESRPAGAIVLRSIWQYSVKQD
jgi:hypothetical protein